MTVGDGLTSVIGYVKDQAGNEGVCALDVRVGMPVLEIDTYYGYQIYPNVYGNISLNGISVSGDNHTVQNTSSKIVISNLSKYKDVEQVRITFSSPVAQASRFTINYGGNNYSAVVGAGQTEAIFVTSKTQADSIEINFGDNASKTFGITRIEFLTHVNNIWTYLDETIYVVPVNEVVKTVKTSFDNGSTWINGFSKRFAANSSNKIIARNVVDIDSEPKDFAI